ncbi:hypothetical protein CW304_09230 [Bacillus sp. UFRGS-B20]|nr:hypothetical protein CW304_09230 [Bacillus sp. UFRGS-B20]
MGKLNRSALEKYEIHEQYDHENEEGSIPRDSFLSLKMQRILAKVFLQQPYSINLKHNFFEIGGPTPLTLIQIAS